MGKTIDDLKSLRAGLIERRRTEAYWIGGPRHDERLEKVIQAHLAIAAIDAVISEGKDEPESDASGMIS